jgi:hypothetical protein
MHIPKRQNAKHVEKGSVVANFATTANDGKTYQADYYEAFALNGKRLQSVTSCEKIRSIAPTVWRSYTPTKNLIIS